jgi:eukaryotic-like serine/threonine-protein kinase
MVTEPVLLERYALYDQIASGGMASVHFGRLQAPGGFLRTVAIKRVHPHMAGDPEFVEMLLAEARLVARIQHPNVVQTLDIVQNEHEVCVVLEYVHGEALSTLLRESRQAHAFPPVPVVAAILVGVLHGLHAAHEARNEQGQPLGIVHRDVSPHNILVGIDGVPRVADFGIAKARGHTQKTRDGQIKGKLAYMAPEQLKSETVDARADVFSCGVILWEALANRRLHVGENDIDVMYKVLEGNVPSLQRLAPLLPQPLIEVVSRALSRSREGRFASAEAMASVLERTVRLASGREVGDWVKTLVRAQLDAKSRLLEEIERHSATLSLAPASLRGASFSAPVSGGRPTPVPASSRTPATRTVPLQAFPAPATTPSAPSTPSRRSEQGRTVPLPATPQPAAPLAAQPPPAGSNQPFAAPAPSLPFAPPPAPGQSFAQPAAYPFAPQPPAGPPFQQPIDPRAAVTMPSLGAGNQPFRPTPTPVPPDSRDSRASQPVEELRAMPSAPRAPPVQIRTGRSLWVVGILLALLVVVGVALVVIRSLSLGLALRYHAAP